MPLLETLVTEMRKARDRNLPYDFQHYIMISKLYKTKSLANGVSSDPDLQVNPILIRTHLICFSTHL